MRAAAADLDFEGAARHRNRLEAVQSIRERQKVVSSRPLNMDVIGFHREETVAGVHVFVVREGRVLYGNEFVLDKGLDVSMDDLVTGFLLRYYSDATEVPREIVVPESPEDAEVLEVVLGEQRGGRVHLTVPLRGEKCDLLGLAEDNARHTLMRFKVRTRYDEERLNAALLQLESALALPAPPLRIEAFDVSTLHGTHSVGVDGRVLAGPARLEELPALPRAARLRRGERRGHDDRGAAAQIRARADGRRPLRLAPVARDRRRRQAAAQRRDRRTGRARPGDDPRGGARQARGGAVRAVGRRARSCCPTGSASLYLVKRVRDEAHRFAIEYHRELRGKAMTASVLDDVPGVGPKRKKALLKQFGSVKRLREATVDEIAAGARDPASRSPRKCMRL